MSFARPLTAFPALIVLAVLIGRAPTAWASPGSSVEAAEIQTLLANPGATVEIDGHAVAIAPLKSFYAARGYRPAWTSHGERILTEMRDVALTQGLPPADYTLPLVHPPLSVGDRDLWISDALVRLGHDLDDGRLSASGWYGEVTPQAPRTFDSDGFLRQAAAGTPLAVLAERLVPRDPAYGDLVKALARYRAIAAAGGWPAIPAGPVIKPGKTDPRIRLLRRRLTASGDFHPRRGRHYGDTLDSALTRAVKRFQARHGLDRDGIVGPATLAALDVPARTRLASIALNLERRRAARRNLGTTFVAVNIPDQRLELVQDGTRTLSMRVVVGRPDHQTPIMATAMSAVIINPNWTVPPSIANREILPKLKKDPNYLVENDMYIVGAFPEGSPQSQGIGIDWSQYATHIPYRLRQRPGPDNALGRIKFHLIDNEAIYMHDTPERALFTQPVRAFSHGCVRLQKPLLMAERLLGDQWTDRLQALLAKKALRTLHLAHPVPVYFLYWTAWADPDGTVEFRNDIYGLDAHLATALSRNDGPARIAARDR